MFATGEKDGQYLSPTDSPLSVSENIPTQRDTMHWSGFGKNVHNRLTIRGNCIIIPLPVCGG